MPIIKRVLASVLVITFALTNCAFGLEGNAFKLSAPSSFSAMRGPEFRESVQVQVGVREALKGLARLDLTSLRELGEQPFAEKTVFTHKVSGTIFFNTAEECRIRGRDIVIEEGSYLVRAEALGKTYYCLLSRPASEAGYAVTVVPERLLDEAVAGGVVVFTHASVGEDDRKTLDGYLEHEYSTEGASAVDEWIRPRMEAGSYAVHDLVAERDPLYRNAAGRLSLAQGLRGIVEGITVDLRAIGVREENVIAIENAVMMRSFVVIPYESGTDLPKVTIDGHEVAVTAHSSAAATYIFMPRDLYERARRQETWDDEVRAYITARLTHEIGAICGLKPMVWEGEVVNSLDAALELHRDPESPAFPAAELAGLKPVDLLDLANRHDYAAGGLEKAKSYFSRAMTLVLATVMGIFPACTKSADTSRGVEQQVPVQAGEAPVISDGEEKSLETTLIHDLASTVPLVRAEAAKRLGAAKSREAVDQLIRMATEEKHYTVWPAVIRALGEIGDPKAVDPFIGILESVMAASQKERPAGALPAALSGHSHSTVLEEVAVSLGRLRDPRGYDVLMRLLKAAPDETAAVGAATGLSLSGDPRAITGVIAFCEELDLNNGKYADLVRALANFDDPRAVSYLRGLLSRQVWGAADALGRTGRADAMDALCEAAVRETDSGVLASIVGALAAFDDAGATVRPMFAALEKIGKETDFFTAWGIVEEMLGLDSLDLMVQTLASSQSAILRMRVLEIVAGSDDQRSIDAIAGLLTTGSPKERVAAVRALRAFNDTGTLPALREAARDSDAAVQKAAAEAVAALEEELASRKVFASLEAYAYLTDDVSRSLLALEDAEVRKRRQACYELGQIHDLRVVAPLVGALSDMSGDVRREAVSSLKRLGWQPASEEERIAALVAALDSRSREALVAIGEPAVPALMRMLDDDDIAGECLGILSKIGSREALPKMLHLVKSSTWRSRFSLIRDIREMDILTSEVRECFRAIYEEAMEVISAPEDDYDARILPIFALEQMGDWFAAIVPAEEAVPALLAALARETQKASRTRLFTLISHYYEHLEGRLLETYDAFTAHDHTANSDHFYAVLLLAQKSLLREGEMSDRMREHLRYFFMYGRSAFVSVLTEDLTANKAMIDEAKYAIPALVTAAWSDKGAHETLAAVVSHVYESGYRRFWIPMVISEIVFMGRTHSDSDMRGEAMKTAATILKKITGSLRLPERAAACDAPSIGEMEAQRDVIIDLFAAGLEDPSWRVQKATAIALGEAGASAASLLPKLKGLLEAGELQGATRKTLDDSARRAIADAVQKMEEDVRRDTLSRAGEGVSDGAVDMVEAVGTHSLIQKMRHEPNKNLRARAAELMHRYYDITRPETLQLLLEAFQQEVDPLVREAMAGMFVGSRDAGVVDTLLEAVVHDTCPIVRLAAMRSLSSGRMDGERLADVLRRMAVEDPDASVRAGALSELFEKFEDASVDFGKERFREDADKKVKDAVRFEFMFSKDPRARAFIREEVMPGLSDEEREQLEDGMSRWERTADIRTPQERIDELEMALTLPDAQDRRLALALFHVNSNPSAIDVFLRVLREDPDESVRVEAVRELEHVNSSRLVTSLVQVLKSVDNDTIRIAICDILGKMGDPAALEPMVAAFKACEEGPDRYIIITSLGLLGDARAGTTLLEAFRSDRHFERECAARALGKVHYEEAAPELVAALKSETDEGVRSAVLEAIVELRRPDAIELLMNACAATKRDSERADLYKLFARAGVRDPAISRFLVEAFNTEKDYRVRSAIIESMGIIGSAEVVDFLREQLDNDDVSDLWVKVVEALGFIGDSRVVPWLLSMEVDEKNTGLAYAVIDALGFIGDPAAIPALFSIVSDRGENQGIRSQAIDALAIIGGEEVRRAFAEAVNAPENVDTELLWHVERGLERIEAREKARLSAEKSRVSQKVSGLEQRSNEILWKYGMGLASREEARREMAAVLSGEGRTAGGRNALIEALLNQAQFLFLGMTFPGWQYYNRQPSDAEIRKIASRVRGIGVEVFIPNAYLMKNMTLEYRKALERQFNGKLRPYQNLSDLSVMIEDPGKAIIMTVGLTEADIPMVEALRAVLGNEARLMNFEPLDIAQLNKVAYDNYIAEVLGILLVGRAITPEEAADESSPEFRMLAHLLEDHLDRENSAVIRSYIRTLANDSLDFSARWSFIIKTILTAVPPEAYAIYERMRNAIEVLWQA